MPATFQGDNADIPGQVIIGLEPTSPEHAVRNDDERLDMFADSPGLDAFQRLRVGSPAYVFDNQFTYDLSPLIFEPVTAQSGASVTHDSTNRNALMNFASTPTGGAAYLQSFEHFRYQPGRSQQVFITFNFIATAANCLKFVGYSDGVNGIELQQNGSTVQMVIHSATTNGTQTVTQANWNLDKMNGLGKSGVTLDLTKTQIFVIDFQALYVGRVRVGFDIGGVITYVHQFVHANQIATPYIQTANLPLRVGMTCTGTVSTTMRFICCSISSNGGQEDIGGYGFSVGGSVSAGSGARTHVLSVRPKTTFNSIANRARFVLDSLDVAVTGNSPVLWEVCLGQAISGTTTFADVNATYSAFEYNTAGTISGSPAIVLFSGYVGASNQSKGAISSKISTKYPITLDRAGVVRALGTLSLIATGIGGASAMNATFNWRELR